MGPDVLVKRVDVNSDLDCDVGRFDYADAFEAHTTQPDARPAIAWLRTGLNGSPIAVRWLIVMVHRHVLRFRLGPASGDHMLGPWRIAQQEHDEARLEAHGPLISGRLVALRRDPHTVRLYTCVTFHKRRAAPTVWAAVGPLHRRVAPHLMKRAAQDSRVAAE